MPNRTIYIRKADIELWDSLADKSQRVSEMLNKSHVEAPERTLDTKPESIPIKSIKTSNNDTFELSAGRSVSFIKVCKHGYHPSFCKFSKSGKPCRT